MYEILVNGKVCDESEDLAGANRIKDRYKLSGLEATIRELQLHKCTCEKHYAIHD